MLLLVRHRAVVEFNGVVLVVLRDRGIVAVLGAVAGRERRHGHGRRGALPPSPPDEEPDRAQGKNHA